MIDPIRDHLDSRLFPHPLPRGWGELLAALWAVLDLCERNEARAVARATAFTGEIRAAIAAALGVEPPE